MIKTNYKGFTLLELLIVVIIVAVLAAVAWPQYKHAVLKSRFSKVMPVAKAVADAQEVYYLGQNYYAQDGEEDSLDVVFPANGEKTVVKLSNMDGYDFVRVYRTDVPGVRYVQYQKHSPNYAGEIHCEAQDGNDDAQWVCKSIGGTNNDNPQVSSDGYIVYIVKGTGNGILPSENGGEEEENDDPNACHEGDTAPASMPQITSGQTGATGTATCVNGKWRYVWSGGQGYYGDDYCGGENAYDCSGVEFDNSQCDSTVSYGCAGNTYTYGLCSVQAEDAGADACTDSTFTQGSTCYTASENGCTNSTFEAKSYCQAFARNGCTGSTFKNNGRCLDYSEDGCSGAIIREGGACITQGVGSCAGAIYEGGCCVSSAGQCAAGTPICYGNPNYDVDDPTSIEWVWDGSSCWDGNGGTVPCE